MGLELNSGDTGFTGKNLTTSVQLVSYTATRGYMVAVRVDLGKGSELLNSAASSITVVAKVVKTDASVVEAYNKAFPKSVSLTSITHNFDKAIYLKEDEALSVWAYSNNASDISISGDVFILGTRSSGGADIVSYTRTAIKDWLEVEFLPLTLATPDDTIYQVVQNAIRYFNTHSAYKISKMYIYATSTKRVQLDKAFKTVTKVYPNKTTSWIFNDHPLWSLLGVTILDNVTSDMIMMSETFKNFRNYVGMDFRWKFEKSEDPDVEGGYLYAINVPQGTSSLYVEGTQRITADDTDITSEYILDWVLSYSKALLRIIEGNTLRKGDIIGIKNDGQEMINEGKEEKKDLEERLAVDGRWVAMIRRA